MCQALTPLGLAPGRRLHESQGKGQSRLRDVTTGLTLQSSQAVYTPAAGQKRQFNGIKPARKIIHSIYRFDSSSTRRKARLANQRRSEDYQRKGKLYVFSYRFWSLLLAGRILCIDNSIKRGQNGYPNSNILSFFLSFFLSQSFNICLFLSYQIPGRTLHIFGTIAGRCGCEDTWRGTWGKCPQIDILKNKE